MSVSVVIPAHPARARNGMLNQALASVAAQTLLPDAVHVVVDHDKAGAPATRQRGLDMVSTDWVAFLDSDDLFWPRHLELLTKHAADTGADFVYSWFKIIQMFPGGRERLIEWDRDVGDGVFPPGHYLNEFDPNDPVETTITVLMRTELAQAVGIAAMPGRVGNTGEDFALVQGCLKAGATIKHLRRFTWYWRHHWLAQDKPGNTSGVAHKGDGSL